MFVALRVLPQDAGLARLSPPTLPPPPKASIHVIICPHRSDDGLYSRACVRVRMRLYSIKCNMQTLVGCFLMCADPQAPEPVQARPTVIPVILQRSETQSQRDVDFDKAMHHFQTPKNRQRRPHIGQTSEKRSALNLRNA
eukprot:6381462-Amphidinium_carterae.1